MFNWAVGIIIFAIAGWLLYKNIKNSSRGKCASCSSDGCSCGGGENCHCH